jgi:multiple sugar transport system substrate-binding protein
MSYSPSRRRLIVGALSAAPIAAAAAACGTSATSSNTSSNSNTSSGSGSGSGSVLTLNAQDYYTTDPSHTLWANTLKSLGKANGSNVTQSSVAGTALIAKVLQEASSHTMPDLLMLDNPDMQQIAATGALTPLDDYGIGGTGYYSSILSAGTYNGKVYGIAPIVNSIALIYNKKILSAAGVKVPTTWDELQVAAKTLTKGKVYGLAMSAIASYEGTWQFLPFFWSAGGDLKQLDSPASVKALTYWKALFDDGSISKSALNWTQGNVNDAFVAGTAAMMVNGCWNFPVLNTTKGLDYGVASIPVPAKGDTLVVPLGGEVWTVPVTTSARQKAAGKVMAGIASAATEMSLAKANWEIPSLIAASNAYIKAVPSMKSFYNEVQTARARTAELGEKWPVAATAIYTAMQAALTGKSTPTAALSTAQKAASAGS